MIAHVRYLIALEARLEFRQKHTLAGIALFALAAVYLCYQQFQRIDSQYVWNAVLWLIVLFTAFNAIGKGFQNQARGQRLYLYWNVAPQAYIVARIVYNMLLMMALGGFTFIVFTLFLGDAGLAGPRWWMYVAGLALGNLGFASLLTLISAIAAQSSNGVGLTAVLGLPIVLPLILILNRYTTGVLDGVPLAENGLNLLFLAVLAVALCILSYLLFPYLWRD
jgi:heme exporter protein B